MGFRDLELLFLTQSNFSFHSLIAYHTPTIFDKNSLDILWNLFSSCNCVYLRL